MSNRKLSFSLWLKKVDEAVQKRAGLSYQDLPDCPYADWYEDGATPTGAAVRAIRMAGE